MSDALLGRDGPNWSRRVTAAVVFLALTFNAGLCFLNTTATRVSDGHVMAVEVALVALALLLALGRDARPYLVLVVFLSYAALVMALRPLYDPKAIRDFLIPITFYLLGRRWGDPRLADRVALAGGIVALGMGLFEALALDVYVKWFNIAAFYAARDGGALVKAVANGAGPESSALFTSGLRSDARTILPMLLGPHRVSSIFLEPVTMGNFGALLFLWALYRREMAGRRLALVIGLAAIVLADARFGLAVCVLGAAALTVGRRVLPVWWFALPFLFMTGFALYGYLTPEVDWANDFAGRMLWAARLITSLDAEAVWGLSPEKPFLADSGFAYTLNQIGLAGVAGLWAAFVFAPVRNADAPRFKACMAAFICLLLTISGSIYSIKLAALLWFMLGSSDGSHAAAGAARASRPETKEWQTPALAPAAA